ncbi:MAG: AAA family ATPase [Chloroflexota bacterium]
MVTWQSHELIRLVKEAYPDWSGFQDEAFVAAEIEPLRKTASQARRLIMPKIMRQLLADGDYDGCLQRIEQIGRATPLLWTGHKTQGDLAPIHAPNLNKWEFCEQMRALLYDLRPSPDRLETFASYCYSNQIPLKWPFPTFFLFIIKPHAEVFVKPRLTQWFMRFMGMGNAYERVVTADMYERYKKSWHGLKVELDEHRPESMLDILALITVAYRVSQSRTGGLTYEAQVALDQPMPLREPEVVYEAMGGWGDGEISFPDPMQGQLTHSEPQAPYSLADFSAETGYSEETLTDWIDTLQHKGQMIFFGPPGTGKTFVAQRLARHLATTREGISETVQFHPAYDYADFVEGLRPSVGSDGQLVWVNRPGIFLTFCEQAEDQSGPAILVIDEINRANLTRVFGELMLLLEYREQSLQLASGNRLQVPPNLFLIGTMNTTDRSLGQLDQAIRRRFAFVELTPDYSRLSSSNRDVDFSPLIQLLNLINEEIADPAFHIGHSYFIGLTSIDDLQRVWKTEIDSLLIDRFYTRPEEIGRFRWETIYTRLEMMFKS